MRNSASVAEGTNDDVHGTPFAPQLKTVSRKCKALKKVVDSIRVPTETLSLDESASTSAVSLPLNRKRKASEINPVDLMDVQTNNVSNTSIDDSVSINIISTVSPLLKKKHVPSTLEHLQLPYQKLFAGRPRTAKASHFAA